MGYWMQKVRCIEAACKCKTCKEFQANKCKSYKELQTQYASADVAADRNHWLEELRAVCLDAKRKPFVREEIFDFASSCSSYTELCKKHRNTYKTARRMKLLNKLKKMF